MKTEELTAIGLSKEQIDKVFVLNGKDIEAAKAAKDKEIAALAAERDGYKSQLETADAALKKFDGIDPEKIKGEIEIYRKQAEDAKKDFEAQIAKRDQRDWLSKKLDEYGVTSLYSRSALISDCMSESSGLKWCDGCFDGFDDFMKTAKEKDAGLYQTAEEKEAAANAQKLKDKAPAFTGPADNNGGRTEKYVPPKIF